MTEDEAKTKWCPMRRVGNGSYAAVNNHSTAMCVGSACMMWRLGEKTFTDAEYRSQSYGNNPSGTQHGYCGLAGKT